MSRTCTPHTSTVTNLTSILTLRTDPHDKVSKTRLDATRILSKLHLQIVQWLHSLLLIYRIQPRTTTRRTSTHRTRTRPLPITNTFTRVTLPGGGVNKNLQHPLERLDLRSLRSSHDFLSLVHGIVGRAQRQQPGSPGTCCKQFQFELGIAICPMQRLKSKGGLSSARAFVKPSKSMSSDVGTKISTN
jgi:hypothetical protein